MSRHRDVVYLKHILDYAGELTHILEGKSRGDLDSEPVLRYAALHLACIIGEAANRVSSQGRINYPEIPWRGIVSMRNMLIHGYEVVDLDVLWDTVTQDIPALIQMLIKILEQHDNK